MYDPTLKKLPATVIRPEPAGVEAPFPLELEGDIVGYRARLDSNISEKKPCNWILAREARLGREKSQDEEEDSQEE